MVAAMLLTFNSGFVFLVIARDVAKYQQIRQYVVIVYFFTQSNDTAIIPLFIRNFIFSFIVKLYCYF